MWIPINSSWWLNNFWWKAVLLQLYFHQRRFANTFTHDSLWRAFNYLSVFASFLPTKRRIPKHIRTSLSILLPGLHLLIHYHLLNQLSETYILSKGPSLRILHRYILENPKFYLRFFNGRIYFIHPFAQLGFGQATLALDLKPIDDPVNGIRLGGKACCPKDVFQYFRVKFIKYLIIMSVLTIKDF